MRYKQSPVLILVVMVGLYVLMISPALLVGNSNYAELWTTSADKTISISKFFMIMSGYYSGFVDNWTFYGITLQILATIVLMPLLVFANIFGVIPDFGFFVSYLRFFQLGLYIFGIFYLYRLTSLLTNRWLGLLGALLCLPMQAILNSMMAFKTDVWVMAFSVAAMFHLIRLTGLASTAQTIDESEKSQVKNKDVNSDLMLAGIYSGLAVSSKIFGIFIIVPAFFALFSSVIARKKVYWSYFFRISSKFFGIMFLTFILTAPKYIVQPKATIYQYINYPNLYPCVPKWGSLAGHLFMTKISNFISVKFGGPLLVVLFSFTLLLLLISLILRLKKFELIPVWIINSYIMAFLTYYFILYNDSLNVYGGHRYIISSVVFMIPVVMYGIDYLYKSRLKSLASILLFLLLVSQILQLFGIGLNWSPRVRLIHWDIFNQWINTSHQPDQEFLRSVYEFEPKNIGNCVTLKEKISSDDLKRLYHILPEFYGDRYKFTHFYKRVSYYTNIENLAGFRVRDWVRMHARPNSVMLVEFYINMLSAENMYTPIDDLPTGTKIIRVNFQNMQIKEDEILLHNPDYIFTRSQAIADWIPKKFSSYQLADAIKTDYDAVFIFQKKI